MPNTVQVEGWSEQTETPFPVAFTEFQRRSADSVQHAGELMARATQVVWKTEVELLYLQAQRAMEAFAPIRVGGEPGATASLLYDRCHQQMNSAITHMRRVSDLMREFGRDLLAVYADSLPGEGNDTCVSEPSNLDRAA